MGLPKVDIQLGEGGLGGVTPTQDGIAGLVLSGSATDGIGLNEPKQIFSVRDLETLKITAENNPLADKCIKAFYDKAGDGAELWIILYSDTTTLETVCDKTEAGNIVKKLLDAAGGKIRVLGINRKPDEMYSPTITNGIDADVEAAMANLQSLLDDYADDYKPARAILPAFAWDGETGNLINLRESSYNRVGIVMWADNEDGLAAIGLTIGRMADIAVHRNLGRVKDGAIAVSAWMTDGSKAQDCESMWGALHTKGFIFPRAYHGKNGFYFNDDPVAAPLTDDYNSLSLGRTIDKAITITYVTYVDELLDNVEVDEDGNLPASTCKYFEKRIENAVDLLMSNEISNFEAYVDPGQNVLSTGELAVVCEITPMGTLKKIVVKLGFKNPALEQ